MDFPEQCVNLEQIGSGSRGFCFEVAWRKSPLPNSLSHHHIAAAVGSAGGRCSLSRFEKWLLPAGSDTMLALFSFPCPRRGSVPDPL